MKIKQNNSLIWLLGTVKFVVSVSIFLTVTTLKLQAMELPILHHPVVKEIEKRLGKKISISFSDLNKKERNQKGGKGNIQRKMPISIENIFSCQEVTEVNKHFSYGFEGDQIRVFVAQELEFLLENPDDYVSGHCIAKTNQQVFEYLLIKFIANIYDSARLLLTDKEKELYSLCKKNRSFHDSKHPKPECDRLLMNYTVSSKAKYKAVIGWAEGLFTFDGLKNIRVESQNDVDLNYSPQSYFMSDLAQYIFDEEYTCHRAVNENFMNRHFNYHKVSKPCTVVEKREGFDPDKVARVDYLYVFSGESFDSTYGHAMIHLIMCPEKFDTMVTRFGEKEAIKKCDKTINDDYTYETSIDELSTFGAVYGSSHSEPFIDHFVRVINRYARQKRSMVSIPIKLTKEEVRLVAIKILQDQEDFLGIYKLFSRNCATDMKDVFLAAIENEKLLDTGSIIPHSVIADFEDANLVEIKLSKCKENLECLKQSLDNYNGENSHLIPQIFDLRH